MLHVNATFDKEDLSMKKTHKGQAIAPSEFGYRNSKDLCQALFSEKEKAIHPAPSGLGTRSFPLDRLAGWQTKLYYVVFKICQYTAVFGYFE